MARDFDGTDDNINFGSDASIDAFTSFTIAMWLRCDAGASAFDVISVKSSGNTNGFQLGFNTFEAPDYLQLQTGWSGTGAALARHFITTYTVGTLSHVVWTYNTGADTNDPVCYLDAVSQTVSESTAPSGTYGSDAAASLISGETAGGTADFDGIVGFYCYDSQIWDAAMVNRHRWWGCAPGGPSTVTVWHPFWTAELVNKGTATATGTATGTTVVNTGCPRVERCWAGMMGVGR